MSHKIPEDHPRAKSLNIREKLIDGFNNDILAKAGLIAHGRGEAFDYILGETTHQFAEKAMNAAVAVFLLANHPVLSVNGNLAALTPREYVKLAQNVDARLEINLFYRRPEREQAIKKRLIKSGAEKILGLEEEHLTTIPEISHQRRIVDERGIYKGDVIFVPLEDGDRTKALRKIGKKVVTIDLNPLSRTAQWSNVTIVDNLVRAVPKMVQISKKLKKQSKSELKSIVKEYNNTKILKESLKMMEQRLHTLSRKGRIPEEVEKYDVTGLKEFL